MENRDLVGLLLNYQRWTGKQVQQRRVSRCPTAVQPKMCMRWYIFFFVHILQSRLQILLVFYAFLRVFGNVCVRTLDTPTLAPHVCFRDEKGVQ